MLSKVFDAIVLITIQNYFHGICYISAVISKLFCTVLQSDVLRHRYVKHLR